MVQVGVLNVQECGGDAEVHPADARDLAHVRREHVTEAVEDVRLLVAAGEVVLQQHAQVHEDVVAHDRLEHVVGPAARDVHQRVRRVDDDALVAVRVHEQLQQVVGEPLQLLALVSVAIVDDERQRPQRVVHDRY